ncbi:hypothetical protein N3K66_003375 [Trichothecium roseum]|uniref:Uncharacterized protein n=1 Tax=Trichothecium roseum TaxID=47278 RepID=A0ACC0V5S8_9HYPO|nr:hypothetical protein N3K66_003375 [Trichothecium roseum]
MDSLMESITKLKDPRSFTDITVEDLEKLFQKIGGSHEKLRTMLNLLFIPDFMPTFIEDRKYDSGAFSSVQILEEVNSKSSPRPLRLIDLETGNLVDSWNTSQLDSYCMLSHRWKGAEITLSHIKRAREQHMRRKREESPWIDECQNLKGDQTQAFLQRCSRISGIDTETLLSSRDNDIHLVLKQCILDLLEQENNITSLLLGNSKGISVGELLSLRISLNNAKDSVNKSRQDIDDAKSGLERTRREQMVVDQLSHKMVNQLRKGSQQGDKTLQGGDSMTTPSGADFTPPPSGASSPTCASTTTESRGKIHEQEIKLANARTDLENARSSLVQIQDRAKDSIQSTQLYELADELISRLQLWKSAIKLTKSIQEARSIFKSNVFPDKEACYIWSDTCCIDKTNYDELSTSLSLMGDWYSNSEFCLVHLDSPSQTADAIQDWNALQYEAEDASAGTDHVIDAFSEITGTQPEWSTRAWTLQELVMSKMAFFVNPQWKPLGRPVERLGHVYPLIPFISRYIKRRGIDSYPGSENMSSSLKMQESDVLRPLLNENSIEILESVTASEQVREGLCLIATLEALNFSFPTNLTLETAVNELTRSVYTAASAIAADSMHQDGQTAKVMSALNTHFNAPEPAEIPISEARARDIIHFLLKRLVSETRGLVVADREYIADFGKVRELDVWKKGEARTGFPAQQIFQLSRHRRATVQVDHVYSLMGILGVRFPTFSAEGFSKALARLLDEAIIAHNDVSIFNWSGVEMASPVRGRSLYPASHKAYAINEDRGRQHNSRLAAESQKEISELKATYPVVINLLKDAIECVKHNGRNGMPVAWLRKIAKFIRDHQFKDLQSELENIIKILLYVKTYQDSAVAVPSTPPPPEVNEDEAPTPEKSEATPSSTRSWGYKPTFSGSRTSSFGKTPKLGGFGMGFGKPSLERHVSEPTKEPPTSTEQKHADADKSAQHKWKSINAEVLSYLDNLISSKPGLKSPCSLPSEILNLDFKLDTSEEEMAVDHEETASIEKDNTTCPNPIIINSSGIDGIFDIQRIIVTMLNRDQLLEQVQNAASSKQKIAGWCTLSTGFSSVLVNFACEREVLRKQLEVEGAVEDRIIKESRAQSLHDRLKDSNNSTTTTTHNDNAPSNAEEASNIPAVISGENGQESDGEDEDDDDDDITRVGEDATETGSMNEDKGDRETKEDRTFKPTGEEKTVARIIHFIQAPKLQYAAGEWVLARFSGSDGAKWFLCNLELGSTHQFHGHRIATTEIDFDNSIVEPGLVNSWKIYMTRKKNKMCKILDKYIRSCEYAKKSQQKFKVGADIAAQSVNRFVTAGNQSLENVVSMGASPVSMLRSGFFDRSKESGESIPVESELQGGKDLDDVGVLDGWVEQGKAAAVALGESTALLVYEQWFGRHAGWLERHLAASVIKKTPKELRTAVEGLEQNKGLLPAMFHAGTRVHMF